MTLRYLKGFVFSLQDNGQRESSPKKKQFRKYVLLNISNFCINPNYSSNVTFPKCTARKNSAGHGQLYTTLMEHLHTIELKLYTNS